MPKPDLHTLAPCLVVSCWNSSPEIFQLSKAIELYLQLRMMWVREGSIKQVSRNTRLFGLCNTPRRLLICCQMIKQLKRLHKSLQDIRSTISSWQIQNIIVLLLEFPAEIPDV